MTDQLHREGEGYLTTTSAAPHHTLAAYTQSQLIEDSMNCSYRLNLVTQFIEMFVTSFKKSNGFLHHGAMQVTVLKA